MKVVTYLRATGLFWSDHRLCLMDDFGNAVPFLTHSQQACDFFASGACYAH